MSRPALAFDRALSQQEVVAVREAFEHLTLPPLDEPPAHWLVPIRN